jgi:transposase
MKDNTRMFAGIDIGDRYSEICLLDAQGEIVERRRIATASSSLTKYFSPKVPLTVALETCSHSSWMNETLSELGATVVVANARKVALIAKNNTKSDKIDAELLARLARSDVKLLSPVTHRSREHQIHMGAIRSRDALVRSRTMLVNHVRSAVKLIGCRLPTKSAASFHLLQDELPASLRSELLPLMASIHALTTQIKAMDKSIAQIADEHYPIAGFLREIHGVGPVTSLAFVLTISDPERFRRNRDVGPYLGMVPRRRQSGDSDPHLRITRAGNRYMRQLLVTAAQHILGPFGKDCDLRRHGLALASRGGNMAKKKAVVAVARKLAVLMLSMWKTGEAYRPFRDEPDDLVSIDCAAAQ